MKTLDRYVIKGYVASYCVCAFALIGLYILVDAFAVTSKLIRHATSAGGIAVTVPVYAFYKVPVFFYQISPYITLMGAMFAMVRLMRQNELIPIKAAGISVYRVLAPIFVISILFGAATGVAQEYVIPGLRQRIENLDKSVHDRYADYLDNIWKKDENGSTFFIKAYRISERQAHKIDITRFYEGTTFAQDMIHAETAAWKRGPDGVERWYLSGGTYHRYGRNNMTLPGWPREIGKDGLVVVRNQVDVEDDADDGILYFVSDLTYKEIEESQPEDYSLMATSSLYDLTGRYREQAPPALTVAIQKRFSWPAAGVLLLMLGLPFALRWQTRTRFVGVGICIAVCAAFFIVDMICEQLGAVGSLNAYASAWLPTVLFAAVGFFVLEGVRS